MAALEIGGADFRTRQQFVTRARQRDRAIDQDKAAIGELQGVIGVLLDEKDGQPLGPVQLA